jgi:primase-polymerase (primpol)-like protein
MDALPAALAPLGAWGQFVAWFAWPSEKNPAKLDKLPCNARTGAMCSAHDPAAWGDFATAAATAKRINAGHGSGVGFVFTEADPFFFLDIDEALGPNGWSPRAQELCARFAGAAVEVSQSGRGLHIIGMAAPVPHGTKYAPEHLELYTKLRFVALTGIHAQGNAAHDCSAAFAATVSQFFPPVVVPDDGPQEWTTEPAAEWSGPEDDDELIAKAVAAAARSVAGAFGHGVTFQDLFTGNVEKLAQKWPHPHAAYDASQADQTLANHLAWWTGKDCERIERIMRRSALVREKWDSPHHVHYLTTTILKACRFVTSVAQLGQKPEPKAAAPLPTSTPEQLQASAQATGTTLRDIGREYMAAHDQQDHFDGCTFITDHLKIYSVHRNKLYSREAFDVEYGGHMFVVDPMGQKTTDSAWLAFTRSRVNVPAIVDDLCFRPELAPGALVFEDRYKYVNTYQPYHCPTIAGDPSPWLNHLAVMLPDANDRRILIEYLAHVAQRPGVKIPWWPVVQGVQGNGKTMLADLMVFIAGEQYSHLPNAAALAKDGMKFNKWVLRKTWVCIEEVSLSNKRDFLEEFKPIVTNPRIPIEGKGVDQITGDNRANGIIFTNHKDGVPIDDNERRYCVFFTAQQRKADLTRDGLTEAYFDAFRAWFYGEGRAIVAGYLKAYALPASLPSRAPETTSTREAIRQSLGKAEQEVLEAIEEGRPGFAGGWVSSKYLDALLDTIKAPVPRNKRRDLMQRLGYDWHPALRDGRVTEVVTPDNGKPKLYVRGGHLALNVQDPAEVARLYSKAQGIANARAA